MLLFEGYSKILPPFLSLALCAESTTLCCCSNSVNWFLYIYILFIYFYFYWKRNTDQPHLSRNTINITRDYFKTYCCFSFSSNTGVKYFCSLSTNIHSNPYSIITYALLSLFSFILMLFRFVFSRDISDDCWSNPGHFIYNLYMINLD